MLQQTQKGDTPLIATETPLMLPGSSIAISSVALSLRGRGDAWGLVYVLPGQKGGVSRSSCNNELRHSNQCV